MHCKLGTHFAIAGRRDGEILDYMHNHIASGLLEGDCSLAGHCA